MTGALAPEVRRWPSAAEAAVLKATRSARLKPCPSNTLKRVVQQLLDSMPRFFNTLTGRAEEFTSLEVGRVRMYTCGPTVYDYAHIGNYRTFVFCDLLRRHLRQSGFALLHVMNLTDVDDKTIRNAAAAGLSLSDYTAIYIQAFFED